MDPSILIGTSIKLGYITSNLIICVYQFVDFVQVDAGLDKMHSR